jgi:hypothetical protein
MWVVLVNPHRYPCSQRQIPRLRCRKQFMLSQLTTYRSRVEPCILRKAAEYRENAT